MNPSHANPSQTLRPVTRTRRFATARVVLALMLREMSTTYGKTWGGYIWAIIEPVGGIVLLTFIFSISLREPPLGTNFAIFYASGLLPFLFYMKMAGKMAQAINFSRPLLHYPAVTFADALIARALMNAATELLVGILVLTFILTTMETRTDLQVLQLALAYLMAFVLGVGVGITNCFLFAWFPVWDNLWGVLNKPLFIMSCLFFVYDDIPQPYADWLWWNPLIHVVGQSRHAFYFSYSASYVSVPYVMGLGLGLIALGMGLLLRYHKKLLNEL